MHVQTHILSGWCVGNLLPLTPRQRLFCMMAASLEDIDGLGIIFGENAYWALHHKLGHSVLFGVAMSVVLASLGPKKFGSFVLYLFLFHLHLGLDVLGSGPNWDIHYLWPVADLRIKTDSGWALYSWQNITAFFLLLAWTVAIAIRQKRTPLEVLMPSLDRQLVSRKDPLQPAAQA